MPPIRPLLRLTRKQWAQIVKRILQREGSLTDKAATEILERYEPPVERTLTRLFEKHYLDPSSPAEYYLRPLLLDYDEALSRYVSEPEKYVAEYSVPSTEIRRVGVEPMLGKQPMGEEAARGIAYERIKLRPFRLPAGLQRTVRTVRRSEEAERAARAAERRGILPEDIRVPLVKYLRQEHGETVRPKTEEVIKQAAVAESIWKSAAEGFGSTRELTKVWRNLLNFAHGNIRKMYPFPKDYYVFCFRKWYANPTEFKRRNPQVAEVLERMLRIVEEQ